MIYCIEDDSAIRDLMVYTLQASGFEARGFESDADFWPAMREQRPELVILDVMLPGEDGLTILRKLRSSPVTADIPVIIATAKDSEYDTVIGLDSGADDYLAKPFGMMEMVSRIRAVLRRSGSKQPMFLSRGIVAMDESKHTVTVNGKAVFLDHLGFPPDEIGQIVTAIGNHDEGTGVPVSALAAALILADKSDVRRSRVRNQDISAFDIHDRVNYSVTKAELKINEAHTLIKLKLTVDTHFSSVMDYFEIFLNRMILCRKAAEKLGLQFKLMINEQQLM